MIIYFQRFFQTALKEIRSYLFWIIFLILVGLVFGIVTAYLIELKEGLII